MTDPEIMSRFPLGMGVRDGKVAHEVPRSTPSDEYFTVSAKPNGIIFHDRSPASFNYSLTLESEPTTEHKGVSESLAVPAVADSSGEELQFTRQPYSEQQAASFIIDRAIVTRTKREDIAIANEKRRHQRRTRGFQFGAVATIASGLLMAGIELTGDEFTDVEGSVLLMIMLGAMFSSVESGMELVKAHYHHKSFLENKKSAEDIQRFVKASRERGLRRVRTLEHPLDAPNISSEHQN